MRRVLAAILAVLVMLSVSSGLAQETGLSAEEMAAMIGETWQEMTAAEIETLLLKYQQQENGKTENGVYTHPAGVRFAIPEGWMILENVPGTTVMLRDSEEKDGFAATISVLVLSREETELAQKSGEDWDAYYAQTLGGYQRLLFDRFEYRSTTACELGILYGENEADMRIQYQFYFLEYGRTYLITLTSLAEEEAYLETLSAYDMFLADFEPLSEENGN